MTTLLLIAACGALLAGLIWALVRQSYARGRAQEQSDDANRTSQAMAQAALVRDRLVHDAAFARRVRDRFSR